jgi:hypothetical protein
MLEETIYQAGEYYNRHGYVIFNTNNIHLLDDILSRCRERSERICDFRYAVHFALAYPNTLKHSGYFLCSQNNLHFLDNKSISNIKEYGCCIFELSFKGKNVPINIFTCWEVS